MYGYKEYVPLTVEEIFKRISEEDVFSIIFEEPILIGKEKATYIAPYRKDNNPDCYFREYNGIIYFIDFADIRGNKDCIQLLKVTYNLSYFETLQYINNYFKLGLGDNDNKVKEVIRQNNASSKIINTDFNVKITIEFLPRMFNQKDKHFWSKYEISKDNLIKDKVIPVDIYRFNTRKNKHYSVRPFDITYAYTDFNDSKVKIYRPYGDKMQKWLTNCSQDDVGNLDSLPDKGDFLIITKSYKDCRVLRNQNISSIWFQNEGMLPNEKIIKNLTKRFKNIMIWFDNDSTGLGSGKVVTEYINSINSNKARLMFLPPILLKDGIKDPSDLIHKKGKKELLTFLEQNNIFYS